MTEKKEREWEEVQPASDLWNWEEQPELEGELVDIAERTKHDGTAYMAYTIEREGEYEDGNRVTILAGRFLMRDSKNAN